MTEVSYTEPRRPTATTPLRGRIFERFERSRETARLLGPQHSHSAPTPDLRAVSPLLVVATAVGSALAVLLLLVGWQTWAGRSDPPVDDLIPLLVTNETPLAADAEPASDAAVAPDQRAPSSTSVDGQHAADAVASEPGRGAIEERESSDESPIVVHISGAVELPGVVQLVSGGRVFHAVAAAGGATADADLDRVNLASALVDGERVHVPAVGEDEPPELVPTQRPAATTYPQPADEGTGVQTVLDLNVATVAELQSLPGVGPATAGAIVRTREERGPFRSVDELLEVPGIGDAKLALLRPSVTVSLHE